MSESKFVTRIRQTAQVIIVLAVGAFGTNAHAQLLPVGSPETFDIATWNVEWFGASNGGPSDLNQQRENVRSVIEQSGIDFWALQEISDSFQFSRLVDSLGTNWVGQLATISGSQRIAFLYNTDVVREGRAIHILKSTDQVSAFAGRPPLRTTVDVVLPFVTVSITIITVHMKCCGSSNDRTRREQASIYLKTHMDFALPQDEPIILLGDLNDELRFSIAGGQATPYQNFIDDPDHYRFSTTANDADRDFSWCSNLTCSFGSTLDHILVSNELFNRQVDNRAYRLESVLTAIPNFVNTTSDHIPVYSQFVFATATATEPSPDDNLQPRDFRVSSVFPNPVTDVLTVQFDRAPAAGLSGAQLVDILGRTIDVAMNAGNRSENLSLDTSALPPGFYVLRMIFGQETRSVRFIRSH